MYNEIFTIGIHLNNFDLANKSVSSLISKWMIFLSTQIPMLIIPILGLMEKISKF